MAEEKVIQGLLVSQIGYELDEHKRAIFRHTSPDGLDDGTPFVIREQDSGDVVFSGQAGYWGETWGSHWWILNFTKLRQEGDFVLFMEGIDGRQWEEELRIGSHILWNESIEKVALTQFEQRAALARNGIGWKDCGADWREVNSHAASIIGLTDLMSIGYEWMGREGSERLMEQIMQGCDYLCLCQQRAADLGLPDGALVHELPNHAVVIPQDQGQAVVALAKASRLVYEIDRQRGICYLQAAVDAYEYLVNRCEPSKLGNFSALSHGAPSDYTPSGFMTGDLLMMVWGGLELFASGRQEYQTMTVRLLDELLARQVPQDKAEDDLYGHFYTFADHAFTEKAFVHHHVGHDTGMKFNHYLAPLLMVCRQWGEHPNADRWRQALKNFTYGYFLPACEHNPFLLLPMGVFGEEGLLSFCGPWHGFNVCYGFAAALAAQLMDFYGDERFRAVATGNLQWLAGLNAGITKESLAGCQFWREDIAEDEVRAYSQIFEVGRRWTGCWSEIPGSVPNGFDTNLQFQLVVEPKQENDSPRYYTDEDWIPHGAGWLSGLVYLRQIKRWRQHVEVS